MSRVDFEFAVEIANTMDWGLTRQDFEFMLELEPQGCFVLLDDSKKIGIATTVSYGEIGWFGNLIVSENRRNRGAGSLLVEHALKYLADKNVETVGLYAYMERIGFYKRLGFQSDSDFVVMKGKGFSLQAKNNVRVAEKKDIREIIRFDRCCFGASRGKLLEPVISDPDNLCFVSVDKGQIAGYVVAKVYRGLAELGPLVCKEEQRQTAIELLKAALSKLEGIEISMFLPERENAILSLLKETGFNEIFKVQRMFHGSPVAKSCISTAESLERG